MRWLARRAGTTGGATMRSSDSAALARAGALAAMPMWCPPRPSPSSSSSSSVPLSESDTMSSSSNTEASLGAAAAAAATPAPVPAPAAAWAAGGAPPGVPRTPTPPPLPVVAVTPAGNRDPPRRAAVRATLTVAADRRALDISRVATACSFLRAMASVAASTRCKKISMAKF